MSREVYSFLAKKICVSKKKEHIFQSFISPPWLVRIILSFFFGVIDYSLTWSYFLIQRNLMKRVENCVVCKINHITIRNDALVFQFAKFKRHQNGEEHVGPWHLYTNPEHPHLCVVLSLTRYLFTYPQLLKDDSLLFQGTS